MQDQDKNKTMKESVKKHGLTIPWAQNSSKGGSTVLNTYMAGGTPWFIFVDKSGVVRSNNFRYTEEEAISIIEELRSKSVEPSS